MGEVYPYRDPRLRSSDGITPEQRGIFYTPGYYRLVAAPRYVDDPSKRTAQRKVSNYFQFLDDDPTDETEEYESPKMRREYQRQRSGLLNRIFAIIFCVSELLLGAALLAFGGARISVYQKQLNVVYLSPLLAQNVSDAIHTATPVIGDGIFIITASLIGIAGFTLNKRGLKMGYLVFAAISVIALLQAVIATSHEISNLNLSDLTSSSQFGLNVALLVLIGLVLKILLQTTIVQSAYGLVPSRLRIRRWPIIHIIVVLLLALFATILVAVSAVGLHQALSINTKIPNLQMLKSFKRDVCVASLVVGLYIWTINFWALIAAFVRSRPLSLAATILYVPGVFAIISMVLAQFTTFIPALHVANNGPDSPIAIYYVIFGDAIFVALFLFLALAIVSVSVFRK